MQVRMANIKKQKVTRVLRRIGETLIPLRGNVSSCSLCGKWCRGCSKSQKGSYCITQLYQSWAYTQRTLYPGIEIRAQSHSQLLCLQQLENGINLGSHQITPEKHKAYMHDGILLSTEGE